MLKEIVIRALTETVTNIGQLSPQEIRELNRATRLGYLAKGKGGPFPLIKAVWARPDYDFAKERRAHVAGIMALAYLDDCAAKRRKLTGTIASR